MEPIYDKERLGNWHQDIRVTTTLKTGDLSEPYNGKSHVSQTYLADYLSELYGDSLKEKTVLDCACNAGGALFESQRVGINYGFGFDVRQTWIDQAEWLKENINIYSTQNLVFKCGGFDLLTTHQPYDISFFNGIFYHLTNPILELTKVANLTKDLIFVNTAYDNNCKETRPCLTFKVEGKGIEEGLTGVEGISWLPNGEQVIIETLKLLGFKNHRLLFKNPEVRRLCVVASKLTSL